MVRVLHVLSQRPSLTGSGITLDALVRHGAAAGWDQQAVIGVPADEPLPEVGGLPPQSIHALRFGSPELPIQVPGMSDVMPYPSTRFSAMDAGQIASYLSAWRRHLGEVVAGFRPRLIHAHHLWLASSVLKDVAPDIPAVVHCHATGLRQMELCPHLAPRVRDGCARVDRFVVLHRAHAAELSRVLAVDPGRVHVVGAGYREDLFHARGRTGAGSGRLLYVGKLSHAKGLPWLLDAVETLPSSARPVILDVVGDGTGGEADALRRRMQRLGGLVAAHGALSQPALAEQMRRSAVLVLPSLYEGLPLVLVEAFACGCRVVATALPGITEQLAPALGTGLELVQPPRVLSVDAPDPADLPAFTDSLRTAIGRALAAPALGDPELERAEALAPFRWRAVFERVEVVWRELLSG